jgi:hypothetical protein
MRRDPALAFFTPDALVNHSVHALNELISGRPAPGIGRATQLAVDYIAHAFQDAAHQPLRQDRVASAFGGILFVSHESMYEFSFVQVQERLLPTVDNNAQTMDDILSESE